MVILFTGMSGIETNSCLEKFIREFREFKKSQGSSPILIKLESIIKEVFYEDHPSESPSNQAWVDLILQQSYPLLEKYWGIAFDRILTEVNAVIAGNPETTIFINLHCCYFHNKTQEYIALMNIESVRKLNPKLIVTLIDDVYEIYYRLTKIGGIYHGSNTTKTEMILRHLRLLDWRSKETMMSRFLAKQLNCKNYLLAVKHSYQTLYNLVIENKTTMYLSHPISEVRRLEKAGRKQDADLIMNEISHISTELSFHFTTFLPTTIDEFRISSNIIKEGGAEKREFHPHLTPRWEADKYLSQNEILYINSNFSDVNELWQATIPEKTDYEINQLLAALADVITDQVTTRDYTLVEQSDLIVLYRPIFNGNASRGVQEEFHYYTALQKDRENPSVCFIYCPQEDIDQYYIKEFNERMLHHLHETKLLTQTSRKFNGITSDECAKLLNAGRSDALILDVLIEVMNDHDITFSITNNKTPLSKDKVSLFKKEFIEELLKSYTVVDDYKQNATFFESNRKTSQEFCDTILRKIKI